MSGVKVLCAEVPSRIIESACQCCMDHGATGTSHAEAVDGRTKLTIFAEESQFPALQRALSVLVLNVLPGEKLQCRTEVLNDDWRLKWTEFLAPVTLTPTLTLVPVTRDAPTYQPSAEELLLEAGLVFGFGEHPTTRMAARWIEREVRGASVFDFGTGSGVLALIAERSGASRVLGIDIDVESVDLAQRNARRNLSRRCSFECAPIASVASRYDVVVANVDALTLMTLSEDVCRCISPTGKLALTGILDEQASEVVAAYAHHGVNLACHATEDDWVLLVGAPVSL